jgi:hypothetical protein
MTDRRPSKQLTLADANKMLPLVAAIVEDWVALSGSVEERNKRIQHLTSGRELASDDPYAEELAEVQRELAKNQQRIQEYVRELRQLGVEPRDAAMGTVDITIVGEERESNACWKLGETEVLYWHEQDADCSTRKRLTADSIPGPTKD